MRERPQSLNCPRNTPKDTKKLSSVLVLFRVFRGLVETLLRFDGRYLAALVIAARWANRMGADGAAALRAFVQHRCVPTVGRFTRAQPHFGGFALWNTHESRLRKHNFAKKQTRTPAVIC
jgi:hypothetical protein